MLGGTAVPTDLLVTGVTLDSRRVRPGDLYAALPGATTHGAKFAAAATATGAAAVLTDPQGAQWCDAAELAVPVIVVPDPRGLLGELSAWIYGDPAADLLLVGITGTNGKTTVSHLVAAALREVGHRTGTIGTIGIHVLDEALPSARTTPEAPDVHAVLAVMRESGVTAVAMEVSSHALVLGRVDGLTFDLAVFTNLSQDHLDFHATMAEYFDAKRRLFQPDRCRAAVICTDDAHGRELADEVTVPVTTYGVTGRSADWVLADVSVESTGRWAATAVGPQQRVAVSSPLPGPFNQANVLGALATAVAVGAPAAAAAAGLATCTGVPGRMEPIPGAGFAAFVDYAHTPDAVARAISAVREFTGGRVLVALGCGGDRDPGKRPLMGQIAAQTADVVVVTDDNPRSEDPAMIRRTVLAGAAQSESGAVVTEIPDRRQAIRSLVSQARPGDAVLILGKGHEQGQDVAGVVTPFDDRVELRAAIDQTAAR